MGQRASEDLCKKLAAQCEEYRRRMALLEDESKRKSDILTQLRHQLADMEQQQGRMHEDLESAEGEVENLEKRMVTQLRTYGSTIMKIKAEHRRQLDELERKYQKELEATKGFL